MSRIEVHLPADVTADDVSRHITRRMRRYAQRDAMNASMPPLIEHLFRVECPACGLKWVRSRWDAAFYPMHYASAHLGIQVFRKLHPGVSEP